MLFCLICVDLFYISILLLFVFGFTVFFACILVCLVAHLGVDHPLNPLVLVLLVLLFLF